jgi:DNA-binding transcriptional ArsR family regulator
MAQPATVKDINDPSVMKALTHPLRIQILELTQEGEWSPKRLSDKLGAPLGNVSYHVRQLAAMGLLKEVGKIPRRGAIEHLYRAIPATVSDAAWEEIPSTVKDRLAAADIRQIGAAVAAAVAGGAFQRPDSRLERRALKLNAAGWKKLSAAADAFAKKLDALPEAEGGEEVDVVTFVFERLEPKPVPQPRRGRPPKDR